MPSSISRRSLLNSVAIGILIAGMGAGDFLYWRSLHSGSGDDDPLASQYDSREYQREIQVNMGTFGAIMDQWSRAISSLGEPKPLAITIMVLSVAAAGGCFIAAARLPRD